MGVRSASELDIQQTATDLHRGLSGGLRDLHVGISIKERADRCDNRGGTAGEDFRELARANAIKELVNIDLALHWFKTEVGGNFQNGLAGHATQDGAS